MSQVFPRLTHTNLLCFLVSAAHVRSANILRIRRHKDRGCTSAATPQLCCSRQKGGSSPAPNPPQLSIALHEDVHGASSGAHRAHCRAAPSWAQRWLQSGANSPLEDAARCTTVLAERLLPAIHPSVLLQCKKAPV